MIRSFADKETERIWHGERSRSFPPDIHDTARRKMRLLNRAKMIDDMRVPPGNRLKQLKGDRKGQYSIRVNDQWRICFDWSDGGADHVRIEDYHD